jgi:polyhydroxyalkanoate synthesis regulator phasin
MKANRKLIFAGAALLAAAGGGVAIAASDNSDTPAQESKAVVDDAAQQLGVSPSKLSAALKKALSDRIDAAVAAGRITKAEGDAIKQRINSEEFPLLLGPHPGFHHLGKLDAAASYIGISEEQLRTELEGGKTLAQVAQAHGKSTAGLIDALVAAAKKHVDEAVAAGRLTQAQADTMLNDLRDRITSMVNSQPPDRGPRLGFRHFFVRPA